MYKIQLLKWISALGIVIMLLAFIIIPDEYPWYLELMLFNLGLWPWLFAKNELKKIQSHIKTD